ncbi:UbiA family prenyltransferase [Azospirillum formosense]|uniref:UbiA family prenyltransferase n=1 Tax=Azospirillum formosense TaxID=861533 RepID=UPI001C920FB8|nr:UbiA family prenyltransferase [Azospirillum formosense]MBY3757311.1 UbiA family prenyltransferase [Azospirillum formosense]
MPIATPPSGPPPPARISAKAEDRRAADQTVPLVVDLDGTLVTGDLLLDCVLALARTSPSRLLLLPVWLAHGKAWFKRRLAEEAMPPAQTLPYRPNLLKHLEAERRRGVPLVLATAADARVAEAVARHTGLFDRLLASDGVTNLTPERKRDRLIAGFGRGGFDYIGASAEDLPVWRAARKTLLVQPDADATPAVLADADVERMFKTASGSARDHLAAVRPLQWFKNGLVFVPMAAAHRLLDAEAMLHSLLAFAAFCLCASGGYLLNDLLDLPADRRHPHKRHRPLASGRLPVPRAVLMIPALLAGALGLAALLPPAFAGLLVLYFALSVAYSLRLKRITILDVLLLAGLYGLRVLAGSAATGIVASAWLLTFSMFLFLSLALVKRYAELMVMRAIDGDNAHARAYLLEDAELLAALGCASGYISVLALGIYASTDMPLRSPDQWLTTGAVCPLLLYWISHVWLIAHRGRMRDDPLVFALKDPVSRIIMVLMGGVLAVIALS